MKKHILTLMAVAALATSAGAQQMDQAAAMRSWKEYMTPGTVHKMLAKSDGKWNVATSTWMDPSAPPMKSTGSVTNKMILGGRYQESMYTGQMMGQAFEGRSLMGYDNKKGMFKSVWMDNMGTGIMTLEGKWDDATHTITFTGMEVDPMSGVENPVRELFTYKDDNHQHMEMYQTMNGQELKMMEIDFTRSGKD